MVFIMWEHVARVLDSRSEAIPSTEIIPTSIGLLLGSQADSQVALPRGVNQTVWGSIPSAGHV